MARQITIEDVRRRARRRVPRAIFEFVDGGAEDERTLARNRRGFEQLEFRPRVLVDVAERDLSVTVLGDRWALPVGMSPAGLARLVHPGGELAAAQAAARIQTAFGLSTASSYTLEAVAEAGGIQWFQLYLWRDRDLVAALLDRAWRSGYRVLCLTVDVPIVGQRERDLRNGMTIPPRITPANVLEAARRVRWVRDLLLNRPITFENFLGVDGAENDSASALGAFVNQRMINPSATWADLDWVREQWEGPLAVKGILTDEEARRAVDHGADAVVVSNHGGRQLDGTPAAIEALSEVVDAVDDRAEVLLDGGIRRGTDVVKALALGARAVTTGRPWFYGLAAGGEEGVVAVYEILRAEIDRTLALLGRPRAAEVDRDAVRLRARP